MGILLKYILHNIQDRKMRTIVMLLSIVLSTTLLFVSLSIGDSYAQAQRKMARGMVGSATLSVAKEAGTIAPENLPVTSMIRSKVGTISRFCRMLLPISALCGKSMPRSSEQWRCHATNGARITHPVMTACI